MSIFPLVVWIASTLPYNYIVWHTAVTKNMCGKCVMHNLFCGHWLVVSIAPINGYHSLQRGMPTIPVGGVFK